MGKEEKIQERNTLFLSFVIGKLTIYSHQIISFNKQALTPDNYIFLKAREWMNFQNGVTEVF